MKSTKFLIQAAVIAAIYATLTIVLMPFSYGPMQVRVSEALTILPFFTPAAIPGLFIGCVVSNMVGPYGMLDIVWSVQPCLQQLDSTISEASLCWLRCLGNRQ